MLASLPNWLLNQWEAWYRHNNLLGQKADPEFRADVRAAKGFATLANQWIEGGKSLGINDLLAFPPPTPEQTPEQQKAALDAMAAASEKRAKRQSTKSGDVEADGSPSAQTRNQDHHRPHRRGQGSQRRIQESGGSNEVHRNRELRSE